VDVDEDLDSVFAKYDVAMFKADERHWSTDSGVARAAINLAGTFDPEVVYVKSHLNARVKLELGELTLSTLKEFSRQGKRPDPSFDPLVDLQAIEMIEYGRIRVLLCDSTLVGDIPGLILNKLESNEAIRLFPQ
jgi:hypothetical protein